MFRVHSGAPWEQQYGYARAIAYGPNVSVAGTTATVNGKVIGVGDPYVQTMVAFGIALDAVRQCGLDSVHVVRSRMYITDMKYADDVGRAHQELFGGTPPVATMVEVSALAHPDHLVEVELEAYAER
ncbi:enamine deaminase RidA (YjgF/YER057c/UK114 family) [Mumia flava]|uniref:Enamine deaminase RidA (YjgF/YER057c/UK114 family) n=1 Tax=Mumia flava TaxID=1348852 RepID=A0A0B2BTD5_9ACTN|nr:Rid family hydrolase [Mumia flava]PJJ58396.1 enamine deaminase RidA (YjgF/YER057c/UK114 family) [Mumia flava]